MVQLPRSSADRWRHSEALVNRVRELAKKYSDEEIAEKLDAERLISAKGNRFTRSSISWIRHKHKIPPVDKKKPHELTVKDVAKRFGVSHNVVYYWIERKTIPARRLNHGSPYWITIDQQKSAELEEWVLESPRIAPK
jgi:excisionase family DNA binding protein